MLLTWRLMMLLWVLNVVRLRIVPSFFVLVVCTVLDRVGWDRLAYTFIFSCFLVVFDGMFLTGLWVGILEVRGGIGFWISQTVFAARVSLVCWSTVSSSVRFPTLAPFQSLLAWIAIAILLYHSLSTLTIDYEMRFPLKVLLAHGMEVHYDETNFAWHYLEPY
jgi:hypothetical protein